MTIDDGTHDQRGGEGALGGGGGGGGGDADAAAGVLDKLRGFISTLDDDERALLAALLAPGVASAFRADEPEVVGFGIDHRPDGTDLDEGTGSWTPRRLPEALAEQIREQDFTIRVEPR